MGRPQPYPHRGTRKKKLYSRDFLGVMLVKLNSTPRDAVRVVSSAFYTCALLPNGKVAVDSVSAFENRWSASEQEELAKALVALGALPRATYLEFRQKVLDEKVLRQRGYAAREFKDAAGKLGIELTVEQQGAIEELTQADED